MSPAADAARSLRAPLPAGAGHGFVCTSDGLRLRWIAWGVPGAPPLVLLHGLRSYAATFAPLAERLSSSWRCLALDARGRGGSDHDPAGQYRTDRYVKDLKEFADQLDLSRFALLGHSMGGATAMVFAAERPEAVRALVIEDMLPGSSRAGPGAERIRAELSAIPERFASLDHARAYWRGLRPNASAEAIESRVWHTIAPAGDGSTELSWIPDMAGIAAARLDPRNPPIDLWPVIPRLPDPTLMIVGHESDFSPPATLQRVLSANPWVSAVSIAAAGHYVHDDQPELFNDAVAAFLAKARR